MVQSAMVQNIPPAEVAERRQRLNEHAYFACMKALLAADKNDMGFSIMLRKQLNISNDCHRAFLTELTQAKREQRLPQSQPPYMYSSYAAGAAAEAAAAHAPMMMANQGVYGVQGSQAHDGHAATRDYMQQQQLQQQQHMQMQQQQQMQQLQYQQQYQQQQMAAKGQKAARSRKSSMYADDAMAVDQQHQQQAAAAASQQQQQQQQGANNWESELPGYKVNHFEPQNRCWMQGVITEYRRQDNTICIVFNMGTPQERREWVRWEQSPHLQMCNEKVDITAYTRGAGGMHFGGR